MSRHGYLTTGEVARQIHVSRSTVSRLVDAGTIKGVSNPITGRRMISMESVTKFLQARNLPGGHLPLRRTHEVYLACRSDDLRDRVRRALSVGHGITLKTGESGAEALVRCAANDGPHLLVIGDDLEDVAAGTVMQALRRHHAAHLLKILLCRTREGSVPESESSAADSVLTPEAWRQADGLASNMAGLLGIRSEDGKEAVAPHSHQRRWPRIRLCLPVKTFAYRTDNPHETIEGSAVILNVSEGGAFLTDMHFDHGALPTGAFRVRLYVDESPLRQFEAHCRVVRMQSNGCLSAGVQFVKLSNTSRHRIASLVPAA